MTTTAEEESKVMKGYQQVGPAAAAVEEEKVAAASIDTPENMLDSVIPAFLKGVFLNGKSKFWIRLSALRSNVISQLEIFADYLSVIRITCNISKTQQEHITVINYQRVSSPSCLTL